MLKIVNAFIKDHRKELGLKGYSKMSYLEKLKYLEGKVKGTKYEREIGKLTKPRVDEGIKKVLDKSGRGKNVRVKKEKKPVEPKPKSVDSLDKLSIKQLIKGIDKFYAPKKVKHPKEPKREKLLAFIKNKNIPRNDFDDKADETTDKDLFLQVSQVMTEKAKKDKLEKFKDFTIEDLRSGLRKYGREKNIRQKGINNASRESMEKFIQEKNIPSSYFKKGGVNRVDIDDILNQAVKFTKDFEKENKSKIIKAILKAKAEGREDSGIEYEIDRNYSTRGKIKKAIRNANNSLSNFKSK